MASRRVHHPVAIELDTMVESFMDSVERMLESTVVAETKHYDEVERKLRELRKRWLAEQTARAMMNA